MEFSHKRHAALKIECAFCHATVENAERAGFPEAAQCMMCHEQVRKSSPPIVRLAALPKTAKLAPEKLLYALPDFVFFSHEKHYAGKIHCENCHGNVFAQDTLKRVLPMKMKACVDCHKAKHATVACHACHELSQ